MRMYCSCIKTLNVEQGYRHIDQEAEDPAPTRFQKDTAMKQYTGHFKRCIQGAL